MSLPISIAAILDGAKVENERLEFKESWDAQASLKTICAFANDLNNWGGGYIVIGVRDQPNGGRQILGVNPDKVDTYLKDILNKSKLIQPDYMPICDVAEYKGKIVIVLWCPGGSTRPYSSPKTMGVKSERVNWIRRISSTVAAGIEEKRELYTLANNVPFDDRPNHEAELVDLDPLLIKSYLKEVGSSLFPEADQIGFEDLCRSMHIVAGPTEYVKPLNVGLLFFSMDPERFFPYAHIDIVEFPDGEGGHRLVEHTFAGPLDRQIRDAMLYLSNSVISEEVVKSNDGSPSERFFNYPPEALREVIANAVYHKGYDTREPIEVRVLPDRIEVLSHPGADRSISIEGIKNYRMACRRYRNRRIGEFLKELGLTEGRNTGIHLILKALRENGSPDPLFETDEDRLFFMATIYKHEEDAGEKDSILSWKKGLENATRAEILTARRKAVRSYFSIYSNSTIVQASKQLGIPIATLNRDIAALKSGE